MMKRTLTFAIYLILAVMVSSGCQQNTSGTNTDMVNNPISANGNNGNPAPVIRFDTSEHDFGKIIAGEKVTFNFKFKNTGNADLVITKASASCGCTVPSYPTTPVAPGKEGVISVSFNSENRNGFQNKTVTVLTNCIPNTTLLRIKAQVMKPEEM